MSRKHESRGESETSRMRRQLRRAYLLMRRRFGHQHWWPGETPFEVCVGAILTQNTSWSNVERAIANLKRAGVMEPRRMLQLPVPELAELLRPSGYFNIKAGRLRSFLGVLVREFDGDLNRMFGGPTALVRERLLSINGIGAETADSMLLYAGGHHSFVIDAYTKRIFSRHGWKTEVQSPRSKVQGRVSKVRAADAALGYEELKAYCESSLNHRPAGERLDYWQDYHAQLVMVGKHFCRTRNPLCDQCPLKTLLSGATSG